MNLKPFLSWCVAKGISNPLVEVQWNPNDGGSRYTVLRQQPTEHGDENTCHTILTCPLQACMIASSSQKLANRLLHEVALGSESEFYPYIQILPTATDRHLLDLPRFWSRSRLDLVTDDGLLRQALTDDTTITRQAAASTTISTVEDSKHYGADLAWSFALVDSRANILPDGRFALTPLLDMINHNASVITKAHLDTTTTNNNIENGVLHLKVAQHSIQHLSEGDEIRISYSELTNLQTLLQYGFVEIENPFNREVVKAPVFRQKPVYVTIHDEDGSIDEISLSALRRYLATESELRANTDNKGLVLPVLSTRNEIEVHALISSYIEESISEATRGASVVASRQHPDALVHNYLLGRAQTLQKGLDRIQSQFPQIWTG